MSAQEGQIPGGGAGGSPPSEEELRAAYEAELKRLKVGDVLLQTAVSLINLAGRRAGLAPDSQDERDIDQLRDAIDAVRALMPILERSAPTDLTPLRNALSSLQMAYAREREAAAAGGESSADAGGGVGADRGGAAEGAAGGDKPADAGGKAGEEPPGPGPAQSSGRLWVPGR